MKSIGTMSMSIVGGRLIVLGLHRLGILLLSVRIRAPDMLRLHGLQVRRQQELESCLGCTLVNTPQITICRCSFYYGVLRIKCRQWSKTNKLNC
jgi:hypothetical protein